MRLRWTPQAACCAVLVAAGMIFLCGRPGHAPETDMRDALNLDATLPSDDPHAKLAASTAQTCIYCHPARGAAAARPKWGEGEPWKSESHASAVPDSGVCLSCHDGSLAGNSKSYVSVDASRYVADGSARLGDSHPIDVSYMAAYAMQAGAFRHPSEDPGIRLEDGKVGCISCHTIHGPRQPGARPGIIETACESCHIR